MKNPPIPTTEQRTYGDYFSGGGLVTIGAIAAGFKPLFGVEYDPSNPKLSAGIADCYQRNIPGSHLIRKSVTEIKPADLPWVYWAHFSTVCKSFSQANANGEENEMDVATAQAVADYITYHRPEFVTVENVWLYRLSHSWRIIANALTTAGYLFRVQKVNMADFGVPQSRERMIVTAMPGRMPVALHATHQDPKLIQQGQMSMFGQLPPWNGWYQAIEDLIPHLQETRPAQWQEKRLPAELRTMMLGNGEWSEPVLADEPCDTVTGNINQASIRAYLLHGTNGMPVNGEHDPASTVVATLHSKAVMPKAYLMAVQGENSDYAEGEQPAPVIAANHGAGKYRAYLFDGKNAGQEWGKLYREGDEPSVFITAMDRPAHLPNAYLIDSLNGNTGRDATVRESNEPATTVQAWHGRRPSQMPHANERGRWVKLDTRCLARFQSVPDSYILPENNTTACAVIGNGVPPLFIEQLAKQVIP